MLAVVSSACGYFAGVDEYTAAPAAADACGLCDPPHDAAGDIAEGLDGHDGDREFVDAHPDAGADVVDEVLVDGADASCTLIQHSNGVGQTWQDCSPLGTCTPAEALAACVAHTGSSAACGSVGGAMLCDYAYYSTTDRVYWGYEPDAGACRVHASDGGAWSGCLGTSDPTWE